MAKPEELRSFLLADTVNNGLGSFCIVCLNLLSEKFH